MTKDSGVVGNEKRVPRMSETGLKMAHSVRMDVIRIVEFEESGQDAGQDGPVLPLFCSLDRCGIYCPSRDIIVGGLTNWKWLDGWELSIY